MGSSHRRGAGRLPTQRVERAAWSAVIAGVVTAVFGFLVLALLASLPSAKGDQEGELVGVVLIPFLAAFSGLVCGAVASPRPLRHVSAWVTSAAVITAASILLAAIALLLDDTNIIFSLALLCWLLSALISIPIASASYISARLSGQGPRGIRHVRLIATVLLAAIIVAFAAFLSLVLRL